MEIAAEHRFRVVLNDQNVDTYTQAEAIEIARRLAQTSQTEVMIYDEQGHKKARVVPSDETSYVDYYLSDHIAISDAILHGKPRIAGGRIPVFMILDLLAAGLAIEDITGPEYYPDLTREEVLACIEYASTRVKDPI